MQSIDDIGPGLKLWKFLVVGLQSWMKNDCLQPGLDALFSGIRTVHDKCTGE